MYDIQIDNPSQELPQLRERYPDAEHALVRYHVSYNPGTDNLEAILRELDSIFPRWYDRDWSEHYPLGPARTAAATRPAAQSFEETVRDYLRGELDGHPDETDLLGRAEDLLAEEAR